MAVNTSPSTPVSINGLILLAYKRAGLLPVEAKLSGGNMTPKLEHGRQLMDLMLDGLAVKGFVARTMDFYDLPILAGEPYYSMPDSVLDVHDDAMFVPSNSLDTKFTTGELVCAQTDVDTWNKLTTKGSESSRPTLYAAFRSGGQVQLRFWPVPSEAGTMRVKTVRLLGGNSDGTKSPDLQRFWFEALVWLLAHDLAVDSSLPVERCQYLLQMGEAKKAECVRYSFEHTSQQAMVSYPTQWSA